MTRARATITIRNGATHVDLRDPDTEVEVRDYDAAEASRDRGERWIDEQGNTCERYFVTATGESASGTPVTLGLERFAEDLRDHAGMEAVFEADESANGLHTLTISRVDFYFGADGSGYDGWGRYVGGNDDA